MDVISEPWGMTPSGEKVELFTLTDEISVKISNYGGTIVSILAPDRFGEMGGVVLGFNTIEGYLNSGFYLGATIGRYADRIANGGVTLEGKGYEGAKNNGPKHRQGGLRGFV